MLSLLMKDECRKLNVNMLCIIQMKKSFGCKWNKINESPSQVKYWGTMSVELLYGLRLEVN